MSTYDEIRYYLFVNSYVAETLRLKILTKYNIPRNLSSSTEYNKFLLNRFWEKFESGYKKFKNDLKIKDEDEESYAYAGFYYPYSIIMEKENFPAIYNISNHLNINYYSFRDYVLFENISKNISGPDRLEFAAPSSPITKTGFYIEITPDLTKRELINLWQQVKNNPVFIKLNENIFFDRKRKDISNDDKMKIDQYVKIENQIKKIKNNKRETYNHKEDDPSSYPIKVAIEDLVDKVLDELYEDENDIDKHWDRYIQKFSNYYYEVIERYKLVPMNKINDLLDILNSS